MIIVTGGAGFIGSVFVARLNAGGRDDVIVVDDLGRSTKWENLVKRRYVDYIHKDDFLAMVKADCVPFAVDAVVHLGACSATTERDADYLMENNFHYTDAVASWALEKKARFIYASSAATYGDGACGFSDSDDVVGNLRPINMYGYSKQLFDLRVLREKKTGLLAGVKFFNVFGPNEYHKDDMTSVIYKAFHQIRATGRVKLFKSYRPQYPDGGQQRDFIYVKDCVEVLWWLLNHGDVNGIFNLGTGTARSWNDLAGAVFAAMGLPTAIDYIEMPEGLRGQYQYFTEASMDKLRGVGCPVGFLPLEETVADYVRNYLLQSDRYL